MELPSATLGVQFIQDYVVTPKITVTKEHEIKQFIDDYEGPTSYQIPEQPNVVEIPTHVVETPAHAMEIPTHVVEIPNETEVSFENPWLQRLIILSVFIPIAIITYKMIRRIN